MKKYLTLFFAAIITLSLTACGKTGGGPENESSSPSGQGTSENAPAAPTANAELKPLVTSQNLMLAFYLNCGCEAENGLYYLSTVRRKDYSEYGQLMYIDYETKQETYLCSDSSCKHNSELCTSYIPQKSREKKDIYANSSSNLFVYNDSLYYFNKEYLQENIRSSKPTNSEVKTNQALYRMNLDGTNRARVFTFEDNLEIGDIAVGDGNAIWFFTATPVCEYDEESEKYYSSVTDKKLIKVDLSDYNIVEQIPISKFKDLTSFDVLGCAGSKIVFSAWEPAGKQWGNNMDGTDYIYLTIDLNNKEMKEIYRCEYNKELNSTAKFTDGGYLYLTNTDDRTTVRVNIENGEQDVFYPAEGYVAIGMIDGKYECHSTDKNDDAGYFIDKSTGEMTVCAARSPFTPDRSLASECRALGKDHVLIYANKDHVEDKKTGKSYDICDRTIMSLDDLLNGRENYGEVNKIFY